MFLLRFILRAIFFTLSLHRFILRQFFRFGYLINSDYIINSDYLLLKSDYLRNSDYLFINIHEKVSQMYVYTWRPYEALKKLVPQSSSLKKSRLQSTESSYKVAECIVSRGKPFTDGDFMKEVRINCSEVLFKELPNRNIILSRIKNLPVSAQTVERRVEDMAADVKMRLAAALQSVNTFSVAVDESMDINDIPRLAIIARYCFDDECRKSCAV